jgi:hypothetical protein
MIGRRSADFSFQCKIKVRAFRFPDLKQNILMIRKNPLKTTCSTAMKPNVQGLVQKYLRKDSQSIAADQFQHLNMTDILYEDGVVVAASATSNIKAGSLQ